MNDIHERVKENIRSEAIAFIQHGIPMPKRAPMWDQFTQETLEAVKLTHFPTVKKGPGRSGLTREQKFERWKKRVAAKQGTSYEEWLKIASALYSIDEETFTVTSVARGPDHKRTWPAQDEFEAQQKVYELMGWKHYDHFEREGSDATDFAYVPPTEN